MTHQHFQSSKRNPVKVNYYWQPPAAGNGDSPENWVLACSVDQVRPPRFGQIVTWRLVTPPTTGQEALIVIARGLVAQVSVIKPDEYLVILERNCHEFCMDPLPYAELRDYLNLAVAGFHPTFGCVEGSLVRLLPECDLAGIADPLINQGDENGSLTWVDWSTICTVEDLEAALKDDYLNLP